MVHGHEQHVIVDRGLEQRDTEERTARQVEPSLSDPLQLTLALALALLRSQPVEIDSFEDERARGLDHLHQGRATCLESGAQTLVPAHQLGKAALQQVHRQHTAEPQSHRNVVCRSDYAELLQKPEPLLGK